MSSFKLGVFVAILSVNLYINTVGCCFITECPNSYLWSSKRKSQSRDLEGKRTIRQCPTCGINNEGECFNSKVCCITGYGCTDDVELASSCTQERHYLDLCVASKTVCYVGIKGSNTDDLWGVCVERGYCCGPSGCSESTDCFDEDKPPKMKLPVTKTRDEEYKMLVSQILKHLSNA